MRRDLHSHTNTHVPTMMSPIVSDAKMTSTLPSRRHMVPMYVTVVVLVVVLCVNDDSAAVFIRGCIGFSQSSQERAKRRCECMLMRVHARISMCIGVHESSAVSV